MQPFKYKNKASLCSNITPLNIKSDIAVILFTTLEKNTNTQTVHTMQISFM